MPQITQLPYIFGSQFFWLVVVFGIIFFVIGRGMLPKIRSTAEVREKAIADDLAKAQAARAVADATEAAWRERADAARVEAAKVAQEARQASARAAEKRIKAAVGRIDEKADLAAQRIRDAVTAARTELEAVAAEAAQEMVERLTGMKIDRKEAAKAVAAELRSYDKGATKKQPAREAAE